MRECRGRYTEAMLGMPCRKDGSQQKACRELSLQAQGDRQSRGTVARPFHAGIRRSGSPCLLERAQEAETREKASYKCRVRFRCRSVSLITWRRYRRSQMVSIGVVVDSVCV